MEVLGEILTRGMLDLNILGKLGRFSVSWNKSTRQLTLLEPSNPSSSYDPDASGQRHCVQNFISTVTYLGSCSLYGWAGSGSVSIEGRFFTVAAAGLSVARCGRSTEVAEVGAGFKPALP